MDYRSIFIDVFNFLYELLGLAVILGISVHLSERIKRLTGYGIFLIFLETVLYYLEQWTQTFEKLSVFRPLLTAAIYSIYPLILVVFLQITTTISLSRKRLLILLIPEFICIPLFFSSQWTHLVFYYYEDNHYAGGVGLLSYLPYILFAFYAAAFIIHNVLYLKKLKADNLWALIIILSFPFFGVIAYLILRVEKDYTPFLTSALVLYYLYIYINEAKSDPLTLLMDRQSYYKVIRGPAKNLTGVVSADMNDLKYLNDHFGHEAGDTALKTVADVMRTRCGNKARVYRVGGDEFMILYFKASKEEVTDSVAEIKNAMDQTDYVCAFGYAMRRPGESVAATILESDEMMYENKAALKAGAKKKRK